ncbi:hypothetical protein Tco_1550291 [Tanacetum coccineum]
MDDAHASMYLVHPGADKTYYNLGDILRRMTYLMVLADAAESVRDVIRFEYCLASSSGWTKGMYDSDFGGYKKGMSPVLWAEIMDREIKKLKRRKVVLVKVRWNSKCGPEFTWEHEDQMRIKYPQLFVDRVVEPAS